MPLQKFFGYGVEVVYLEDLSASAIAQSGKSAVHSKKENFITLVLFNVGAKLRLSFFTYNHHL